MEIAAGALAELPMASSSTTYRSPYAPPTPATESISDGSASTSPTATMYYSVDT